MIPALQEVQTHLGATFASVAETQIPISFDNDAAALQAACGGVALCDRSHWGLIRVSDGDRLRFLHNQSTNSFETRQPGEGCDTVFVTSTARTIDLVTAYILEDAVLLLVSPNRRASLIKWMDRYIFFADKVKLEDLSSSTAVFSLIGPEGGALLQKLGVTDLAGQPYGTHRVLLINNLEVRVAVGSGLASPGYTLLVATESAASLWKTLVEVGAVPLGEKVWETLRVEQGRPVPEKELTEDFNPLEAGLWNTISLTKGCYIGQETIARLHTYKGVKQKLWGIKLASTVAPNDKVVADAERAGVVTSCIQSGDGYFALAYIRTKVIEAGTTQVQIERENGEQVEGELVAVPFVSHEYL